MSSVIGSTLSFSVHFENAAGADADPSSVRFFLREEIDGTELAWVYDASAVSGTHYPVGMNPIVKDSVGDYSLAFVSRKAERHTGVWVGSGTIFDTKQETRFVRHAGVQAVDDP